MRIRLKRTVVILPALVTLVLSLVYRQGMRATDDLGYAEVAMSHVKATASPPLFYRPDFHDGRLGAMAPLATVFWLFGAGDLSLALLPLICTVLTASLVAWLACRFWGEACGLVAGLLFAFLPLTVGQSTFYVPEPIATFEMCLAVGLVLVAVGQGKHAALLEFVAGVVIGIAYLTTEVGALMLPVLFLYLWLVHKGPRRGVWLVGGFAVVLTSELIFHAVAHGSPFYRFTLTQGYGNDPLVRETNSGDTTYRLFKAYPALFVYPNLDFGVSGGLMVLGGFYGLLRWRDGSLFVLWAAIILLFYNFMTASLTHYTLIPVAARHVAPACVPLLILAAKLLVDVWRRMSMIARTPLRLGIRGVSLAGAGGLALCSLVSMYLNTAPTYPGAVAQNAALVARFLRQQPAVTVVSDPRTATAVQFYRGYNPRDAFFMFDAVGGTGVQASADGVAKPVFVILNGPVLNKERITGDSGELSEANRQALERIAPQARARVLTARFADRPLVTRLLRSRLLRYLAGQYTSRVDRMLLAENPALSQVRVYRYSPSSDGAVR